jgi:ATP-dependent helicase/nuclease subunit B
VQIEAGKQKEINKGSDLYNAAANLSIDFDWSINKTEIELQREVDPFFKSEYNGFILSDEYEEDEKVKKYLNEYSSRQYSISQLETYAKCPFKFFIEKVLKVDSVEEPNEEIESIELGRILHSILFRFYSTVTEKGLEVNSCDEEKKSALRKIIFDIAEDEISRTPLKSPLSFFEIEKLLGINGNFKDSILNKFIEYECENNVDLNPAYFEVRFGTMKDEDSDTKLSSSAPLKIDNIQLRGKIDRIDISQSSNSFDVVDYKLSGQKPTFKELKEGISLQLPVYLLAAAELLRKKYKKEFNPNAMIIFSLKYSLEKFGKQKVVSTDKEITTMDKLIESTISHIKKYIQQISEGQFFISPHEEREKLVCKYCGFSSVCRVNNLVQ